MDCLWLDSQILAILSKASDVGGHEVHAGVAQQGEVDEEEATSDAVWTTVRSDDRGV